MLLNGIYDLHLWQMRLGSCHRMTEVRHRHIGAQTTQYLNTAPHQIKYIN